MSQITWPDQYWKDMVPSCSPDTDALRKARDSALAKILEACAGRPIVAVSGSGAPDSHRKEAQFIGELIARLGLNLINGGIDGVMFDVTAGFLAAASKLAGGSSPGVAIRVVPSDVKRVSKAKELSERLVGAKCIFTELETRSQLGPDSRNHVLIAAADVVICLPGQEDGYTLLQGRPQDWPTPPEPAEPAEGWRGLRRLGGVPDKPDRVSASHTAAR